MVALTNLSVSCTVIIISKDRKVLVVRRLPTEKAFPMKLTVAGGKLEDTDGYELSDGFRYYSCEICAIREVKEELGIELDERQLKYLCSITTVWNADLRRVILSYYVVLRKNSDNIKITLNDNYSYDWLDEEHIKVYRQSGEFIPDIGKEILEVFEKLRK